MQHANGSESSTHTTFDAGCLLTAGIQTVSTFVTGKRLYGTLVIAFVHLQSASRSEPQIAQVTCIWSVDVV